MLLTVYHTGTMAIQLSEGFRFESTFVLGVQSRQARVRQKVTCHASNVLNYCVFYFRLVPFTLVSRSQTKYFVVFFEVSKRCASGHEHS